MIQDRADQSKGQHCITPEYTLNSEFHSESHSKNFGWIEDEKSFSCKKSLMQFKNLFLRTLSSKRHDSTRDKQINKALQIKTLIISFSTGSVRILYWAYSKNFWMFNSKICTEKM